MIESLMMCVNIVKTEIFFHRSKFGSTLRTTLHDIHPPQNCIIIVMQKSFDSSRALCIEGNAEKLANFWRFFPKKTIDRLVQMEDNVYAMLSVFSFCKSCF